MNPNEINETIHFEIRTFWQHRKAGTFVFISGIDHVNATITLTDTVRFSSITIRPAQVRGIYDEIDGYPKLTVDELAAIAEFLEYKSNVVGAGDVPPRSKHFRPVGVKQFHDKKSIAAAASGDKSL